MSSRFIIDGRVAIVLPWRMSAMLAGFQVDSSGSRISPVSGSYLISGWSMGSGVSGLWSVTG